MSTNKDFKRVVRTRMRKTGEAYTAARAALVAKAAPVARVARSAPPAIPDLEVVAGMKDATVRDRTGKSWQEWCEVLDAAGAREWTHTAIARHVHDVHGIGKPGTKGATGSRGWWAQTVTVGYERIRGLRAIGQRRAGTWEASRSRTFAVPVAELFRWFGDSRRRGRWLPGIKVVVRKATAPRSIRITWPDGTSVEGWFQAKGAAKSSVAVQHVKLADKQDADARKVFWGERLDALSALLEAPAVRRRGATRR